MKKINSLLALGATLTLGACTTTPQKPNIVFFLVDDYGWADSSVAYGEEVYKTNLRHDTPFQKLLSEQGAIMTNAYACPVSTPTRASLMTGMNASHMWVTNFTSPVRDLPSDGKYFVEPNAREVENPKFDRPLWNYNGISPVDGVENTCYATPLAQLLKDNGYFTICVGKGHWATPGTPGASPYNFGFVVNVSGNIAGRPGSYLSEDNYGNTAEKWTSHAVQNMTEYYGSGIHLTEALTREALKTLDYPISHNEPFYLYMSHHAVHTPIQGDDRFLQKYLERGMDEGQAKYASLVEGVDKSLGDIMHYLEQKGVAQNTIIIFMGDNGGNSITKQKGGEAHTQNKPLREGKGSCYEGGIRVPLLIKWPNQIQANTRLNTPVVCEDIFPTILSMAGIRSYKTVQAIDGEDLTKLLIDGSKYVSEQKFSTQKEATKFVIPQSISGLDPKRAIISNYPHRWKPSWNEDIDYMSSIRKGDWKLVYRMLSGTLELYNISEDIEEKNDVASQHEDIVRELALFLSEKFKEWKTPMPRLHSTLEEIPLPACIIRTK
ncbi:MAG: sulfatase-like hydrolase/transferase [Alistipes sp.]|nr:sulfatase-like hydrolase/transferase [Candidatus Alistipes equi]